MQGKWFAGTFRAVVPAAVTAWAAAGDGVVRRRVTDAQARGARLVLLVDDDDGRAWGTLDRWRRAGLDAGVVIVGDAAPGSRAELEPVEVLPDTADVTQIGAAVARLAERAAPHLLDLGDGVLDVGRRRFEREGSAVDLTQREVDLLAYLAHRPWQDVPRDDLLVQVWGHKRPGLTRAVDMAVVRLRRKIERDPASPRMLLTSRGDGYRLQLPRPPIAPAHDDTTGLVGRAADLERIERALAEARAVTVAGPPGVGKSRVLQQIAVRTRGALVDLHATRDVDELWGRLAHAIGADIGRSTDARQRDLLLGRALAEVEVLLFDHADGWLPVLRRAIGAWVGAHSRLRVVVAARTRASMGDGAVVLLAPLDAAAAAELFRIRARAAGGVLGPGDPIERLVERLVERLDHLPLAIELAAWRAGSRSVAEVLDGLSSRFQLLQRSEPGEAPLRLADAIESAWDQLEEPLRDALAALSVVPGPFDRALATAVVGDQGPLDPLVDASLVQRTGDRYRVLGSIRDLALGKGRDPAPARARLVASTAGRARALLADVRTDAARAAIDEIGALEPVLASVGATLVADAGARPEDVVAVTLAIDAWRVERGTLPERQAHLEAAACHPALTSLDRARLLGELVRVLTALRPGSAGPVLDEAVALAADDPDLRAELERLRAELAMARGEVDLAAHAAEASLSLASGARDPRLAGLAAAELAHVRQYRLGADGVLGDAALMGCMRRAHASPDPAVRMAVMVREMGLRANVGDAGALGALVREAEATLRVLPDRRWEPAIRMLAGVAATRRGAYREAVGFLDEAIALLDRAGRRSLGARLERALALVHLAHAGAEDALHDLERAYREVSPRGAHHARELLVLLHLDRREHALAEAVAEASLREPYEDRILEADLRMQLGLAIQAQGRHDEAARIYGSIPRDVLPLDHLTDLHVREAALARTLRRPDAKERDAVRRALARLPGLSFHRFFRAWLEGAPLPEGAPVPMRVLAHLGA